MLRIEQFEDSLFLITLEVGDEVVRFHGLFQAVDVDSSELVPCSNGISLVAKLRNE